MKHVRRNKFSVDSAFISSNKRFYQVAGNLFSIRELQMSSVQAADMTKTN